MRANLTLPLITTILAAAFTVSLPGTSPAAAYNTQAGALKKDVSAGSTRSAKAPAPSTVSGTASLPVVHPAVSKPAGIQPVKPQIIKKRAQLQPNFKGRIGQKPLTRPVKLQQYRVKSPTLPVSAK